MFCPKYRCILVTALVVAVEGCFQGGGNGTDGIFDVSLGGMLRRSRTGGFVQEFFRDLEIMRCSLTTGTTAAETYGESYDVGH